MNIKGYKVFNPDWTCMNKQYTCPGTFEEDVNPSVCNVGMHFCKNAVDCFRYYDFDPNNHVAEVIAHGTVVEGEDKCATNKLEIVREIPWAEVLEIVNTGKTCTGRCNSGNYNSGNWNSGDYNSGDYNSGDYNSGNRNSGNYNSGDYNSGDYNSGYCNSGDYNSGDYNSGDYNSGNRNSGDWNKTSFSNGCFNTVSPKIYMFNKPTDWTFENWLNCRARYLLNQIDDFPLKYVCFDSMTDDEKAMHPEAETTGGYLKEHTIANNVQKWWDSLDTSDRNEIFNLPNFDAAIFKEIMGIDVSKT